MRRPSAPCQGFSRRSFVRSSFVRSKNLAKLKFEKLKFENVLVSEKCFSSISVDFGGARRLLTSKSDSLTNFASDILLLRSV